MASIRAALFGAHHARSIGRYRLERLLGAGSFGVVHAARDMELQRTVALKLMLRAPSERETRRFLREAKALARLDLPGVPKVFDVGIHHEEQARPFIVTELIEGETLDAWLTSEPRSLAERLEVLLEVARTLTRAHARGIVHRDVKPKNIMVDRDGRPFVLDFGMATLWASLADEAGTDSEPGPSMSQATANVVGGTPRYVAPEQADGAEAHPANDQFSWCVVAFEALYEAHPFPERWSKDGGRVLAPRKIESSGVPEAIRRVLERGMRPEPEHRFDGLDALIEALRRARRPWWRTPVWVTSIGAAVAATAAVGLATPRPCGDEGLAPWSAETAAWLERHPPSSEVADVRGRVAERAERVRAAWQSICEQPSGSRSVASSGQRCIDARREELEQLVEALRSDDADAAVAIALRDLPAPKTCLEHARGPGEDEAEGARRPLFEAVVARAQTLLALGRAEEGLAIARTLRETVQDEPGPRARVTMLMGRLHEAQGHYDRAQEQLEAAYADAFEAGRDATAFEAALELGFVVGIRRGNPQGAEPWLRQAEALDQRLVDDVGLRRSRLLLLRGEISSEATDYPQALTWLQQAASVHGEGDDAWRADLAMAMGNAYLRSGRVEQAAVQYRLARDAVIATLGPDHVELASVLDNLGQAEYACGRVDEATTTFERAAELLEGAPGEYRFHRATLRNNLGLIYLGQGDLERAHRELEVAHLALRELLGEEHARVASVRANLGVLAIHRGDPRSAVEHFRVAHRVLSNELGAAAPSTLVAQSNLGGALSEAGEVERGEALAREATEQLERLLDPGHAQTAEVASVWCWALIRAGQIERAIAVCGDATETLTRAYGGEHPATLPARHGLGRAYLDAGRPHDALPVLAELYAATSASPPRGLDEDLRRARAELASEAGAVPPSR